jgi:hypothetical protein
MEIQQRATEYSCLMNLNNEELYSTMFDIIPTLPETRYNDLCFLNEKPIGTLFQYFTNMKILI